MLSQDRVQYLRKQGRKIHTAQSGDADLGPLSQLPGIWKNANPEEPAGWNMIALPFAQPPFNYRLLLNRYHEELKFCLVDKAVPNRGITGGPLATAEADQFVVTLDYVQMITQTKAADFPVSGDAGGANLAIHHEPGLWLHMTNETTNGIDIARLATVPHGNSALALGRSVETTDPPQIADVNGLPIGVPHDLDSPYLLPYKHFHDNKFDGLFDPTVPNELLKLANQGVNIVKSTVLEVDSTLEDAGISNIPFIVRQADAASMKSTFWIQELAEKDAEGNPKLRLQYSQIVLLDFFPRPDGFPGDIRWPHVSINTLEKVAGPEAGCP